MKTNNLVLMVAAVIVFGLGVYFFLGKSETITVSPPAPTPNTTTSEAPVSPPNETSAETPATSTPEVARGDRSVLGTSAGGNEIVAYHFGTGDTELLFVGGIHGGYSYNTTLLAYELIDHLTKNPKLIPENVTVTVVPTLNPDGLKATVGTAERFAITAVPKDEAKLVAGRFNASGVDLNRNFDCQWKKEGTWQNRTVSGGDEAFSEPEAKAIRSYVEQYEPAAVLVWYSAAGGVYASNCENGVLPKTTELVNLYAKASGYTAYNEFNYYEITGDMVNWLAKERIPAFSVLLTTHTATEWSKNRAGIEAMIKSFAE